MSDRARAAAVGIGGVLLPALLAACTDPRPPPARPARSCVSYADVTKFFYIQVSEDRRSCVYLGGAPFDPELYAAPPNFSHPSNFTIFWAMRVTGPECSDAPHTLGGEPSGILSDVLSGAVAWSGDPYLDISLDIAFGPAPDGSLPATDERFEARGLHVAETVCNLPVAPEPDTLPRPP